MKWLHGSEKRIKSKKENDCHAAFGGCGQFFCIAMHSEEIKNIKIQEEQICTRKK